MRYLLDTNVLLRLAEPGHAGHRAAMQAVERLERRGDELCIVPQILYEFWSVATRPTANNGLGMSTDEAREEIESFRSLFWLLRDERGIYARWQELVRVHSVKGKQAHDARIVASMLRHGITHLLTFNDRDFIRYQMISAIHPDVVMVSSGTSA